MRKGLTRVFPLLLLALLLSACQSAVPETTPVPTPSPAATTERPAPTPTPVKSEEIYQEILENCQKALYSDAFTADDLAVMELCPLILKLGSDRDSFGYYLRDVNGDGTQELFLGMESPDAMQSLFQIFTLRDGSPVCLYTVTEGDALYLCRDATLLQEGMEQSGRIYLQRYSLTDDGMIRKLDGLLYDPKGADGTCFSVGPDGETTTMSEADFLTAVQALDAERKAFRFLSIREYSPESALPSPSSETGSEIGYYTHSSLYDGWTGIRAADLLIPTGWDASLELNWDHADTAYPGTAVIILQSADGHAAIRLSSEREYLDPGENAGLSDERADKALLSYRDAESVQALSLRDAGFAEAELLRTLPTSAALWETAARLAEAMAGESHEGTAACNLYQQGDTLIECLTLVAAAEKDGVITWSIPLDCVFIADSEIAWLSYLEVFESVAANSDFTADFRYLNSRFGAELPTLAEKNEPDTAKQLLRDQSAQWLKEYAASDAFVSGTWPGRWLDVIDPGLDFQTADGGVFRIQPVCERLFQAGSRFYAGPEVPSGGDWTELSALPIP